MKREMKDLESKIKALRNAMELASTLQQMELASILQQDDVVRLALAKVEDELDKFRFK